MNNDKYDIHGYEHPKYNQQDTTLHNLFISMKCSTRFRQFLRPSSGAQKMYIQLQVLCQTFYCYLPLSWKSWNSSTLAASSSIGCQYLKLYIQFWAPDDGRRNRLKHIEHFTEINRLCNVASCWLYLEIRNKCVISVERICHLNILIQLKLN